MLKFCADDNTATQTQKGILEHNEYYVVTQAKFYPLPPHHLTTTSHHQRHNTVQTSPHAQFTTTRPAVHGAHPIKYNSEYTTTIDLLKQNHPPDEGVEEEHGEHGQQAPLLLDHLLHEHHGGCDVCEGNEETRGGEEGGRMSVASR